MITKLKKRRSTMRTWGWSMLATGAGLMLGGGGLWLGPVQGKSSDRDTALQGYLNASPEETERRLVVLAERDNELQSWQSASVITAATGGVLSAIGGILLGVAPSVEPEPASAPDPNLLRDLRKKMEASR